MRRYPITPCPAPRQTKSDAWKTRPCVLRYRAFKYECARLGVTFDNGESVTFIIPMPDSYSEKKKARLNGQPHTITPDTDNLFKALLDSIFKNDAHIWHIGGLKKIWGYSGEIIIE